MNYRLAQILAEESADTAATKTIPIEIADPISRISIFFRGQNDGDDPLAHPAKMISKIEILDGSDVLMSLSGMQAQALDFYNGSKPIQNKLMYTDGDWSRMIFNLNFGRHLYDPILALDPTKFKNPQLKITHNKALGGCTCDAGYLEVWADCFDEKVVTPEGFLMAKENYSFALTASAYEYIDLPKDYPYRMILVSSLKTRLAVWELFDKIKLSSDNDKRVIIDGDTRQLIKMLDQMFGPYTETIQGIVGAAYNTFYITPTSKCNVVTTGRMGAASYFTTWQTFGGTMEIIANAADQNFQSLAHGYAPHGALAIPFGDLKDPEDWFDVSGIDSLKLRIRGEASVSGSPTCDVVIQQLRKY